MYVIAKFCLLERCVNVYAITIDCASSHDKCFFLHYMMIIDYDIEELVMQA